MTAFRWIRCECCATEYNLTTHHCWPKAASGHGGAEVTLCKKCHRMAHDVWGPGDRYRGPREAKPTIVGLRKHIEARKADSRVAGMQAQIDNLKAQLQKDKERHRSARSILRKLLRDERKAMQTVEADRDDLMDRVVALEGALEIEA